MAMSIPPTISLAEHAVQLCGKSNRSQPIKARSQMEMLEYEISDSANLRNYRRALFDLTVINNRSIAISGLGFQSQVELSG